MSRFEALLALEVGLASCMAHDLEVARGSELLDVHDSRTLTLAPLDRARLFTDRFSGCTGIGFVALLGSGDR